MKSHTDRHRICRNSRLTETPGVQNSAIDRRAWKPHHSERISPSVALSLLFDVRTGRLFTPTRTVISCHRSQTSLSRLILLGFSVTTLPPRYLPQSRSSLRGDGGCWLSLVALGSHDEHYANCISLIVARQVDLPVLPSSTLELFHSELVRGGMDHPR